MPPKVLYVTDLTYPARGRRYADEDIYLTGRLREHFRLALCHPLDARVLMDGFDAVVVRNSGPVLGYVDEYEKFKSKAVESGTLVYNPLSGRGDMAGKQYLVDLFRAGYPVIPTVDRPEDVALLPTVDEYVVKPRQGADSIGLEFVGPDGLRFGGTLVQPRIRFRYEVSFYFVDDFFAYALYAPDPDRRWDLAPYEATDEDLAFARRFVEWNAIGHGIQRVDACRTPDGGLLLVEVEDLNPYLSLDLVDDATRDRFVSTMVASVNALLA